jgi:hypothetical protein
VTLTYADGTGRTLLGTEIPARSGAGAQDLRLLHRLPRSHRGSLVAGRIGPSDLIARDGPVVLSIGASWPPDAGEWRRIVRGVARSTP